MARRFGTSPKPYDPDPKTGTPRRVECPECGVKRGYPCRDVRTTRKPAPAIRSYHPQRRWRAREENQT